MALCSLIYVNIKVFVGLLFEFISRDIKSVNGLASKLQRKISHSTHTTECSSSPWLFFNYAKHYCVSLLFLVHFVCQNHKQQPYLAITFYDYDFSIILSSSVIIELWIVVVVIRLASALSFSFWILCTHFECT